MTRTDPSPWGKVERAEGQEEEEIALDALPRRRER
jgi:hypothetical protein